MPTLLLKLLNPKTRTAAEVVVVIVFLLFSFNQWQGHKTDRARLRAAETALQNPKVVEVVKTVKVSGPTRTIYKYRQAPDGSTEMESEEIAYGWSEDTETGKTSEPVALETIAPTPGAKRADRWLLGLDLRDFSPRSSESWTAYAGYSFRNRLDVLAGARMDDGVEPHVMVVGRF